MVTVVTAGLMVQRNAPMAGILEVMQARASAKRKRIIITGASGTIGRVLMRGLADRYEVIGVDKEEAPGVVVLDLLQKHDATELKRLALGSDVLIHLAWDTRIGSDDEEGQARNKLMTEDVFREILNIRVPRVIAASSVQVCFGPLVGYERGIIVRDHKVLHGQKISVADAPLPVSAYGRAKVYLEEIGREYAQKGTRVIAVRFGNVTRDDNHGEYPFWLSQRDCVQFIGRCIEATSLSPFSTFFAVSANACNPFDLSDARRMIGYEPQDGSLCPLEKGG